MPANAAQSSPQATAVAPDGIAIHTFALPAAAFVSVVEGRIPPGRYGVHRHLSLEQYTYVLAGRVTAITGNAERPNGAVTRMEPGDLLLTSSGESLQFINEGDETTRVLFICAPPHPPDDSDTRTLAAHGPLGADDIDEALARLATIREAFNRIVDERAYALQRIGR